MKHVCSCRDKTIHEIIYFINISFFFSITQEKDKRLIKSKILRRGTCVKETMMQGVNDDGHCPGVDTI